MHGRRSVHSTSTLEPLAICIYARQIYALVDLVHFSEHFVTFHAARHPAKSVGTILTPPPLVQWHGRVFCSLKRVCCCCCCCIYAGQWRASNKKKDWLCSILSEVCCCCVSRHRTSQRIQSERKLMCCQKLI